MKTQEVESRELPSTVEQRRLASPAVTPQALTWHGDSLWMGSRDLRRIYKIDTNAWTVLEEMDAPGIPWAAVATGEDIWFTIGEGPEDDRYLRRYLSGKGFSERERIRLPGVHWLLS